MRFNPILFEMLLKQILNALQLHKTYCMLLMHILDNNLSSIFSLFLLSFYKNAETVLITNGLVLVYEIIVLFVAIGSETKYLKIQKETFTA
jgi:hypothetical protein